MDSAWRMSSHLDDQILERVAVDLVGNGVFSLPGILCEVPHKFGTLETVPGHGNCTVIIDEVQNFLAVFGDDLEEFLAAFPLPQRCFEVAEQVMGLSGL